MTGGACLGLLLLAAAAPDPAITVTLAPRLTPAGGEDIATIDVELRFEGVGVDADAPLVRLPLVVSNVDTAATLIARVDARDARGALPLWHRDIDLSAQAARDAEIGGRSREWIARRKAVGTITLRYTVPAYAALPPRGPAPPLGFSNDGSGTSAAGSVFLLLPPGKAKYRTHVRWDLSALPPGARGVSSYGEGRVTAPAPLDATELAMSFYMAGRIGVSSESTPGAEFFAAWQGAPPFAAEPLMQWTGTLYGHYTALFGAANPQPYGVFLRYNPVNAGGGVGLHRAFVTTFGRPGGGGSDADEIRFTLAHEMFHTFQPFIGSPAGLESSWFGEGLATYYQRALPLRFGMIGSEAFLDDLNFHAGRYYSSAMASAPNSEVAKRFWADTRIRTLPYDRGMLYFAGIDEAMRRTSGGKRSLDTLVLAMLELERAGKTTTNADWEALLARDLGAPAVLDFRAFLDGAVPLPGSGAFGPCFRRVTRPLKRYELGFDSAVLAEPKRIVRGLVPGSAAAAAGLRDGDEIVAPVPQDDIQGRQGKLLELLIRRDGKTFALSYLPRGETVAAYQWERVPAVPEDRCAL